MDELSDFDRHDAGACGGVGDLCRYCDQAMAARIKSVSSALSSEKEASSSRIGRAGVFPDPLHADGSAVDTGRSLAEQVSDSKLGPAPTNAQPIGSSLPDRVSDVWATDESRVAVSGPVSTTDGGAAA